MAEKRQPTRRPHEGGTVRREDEACNSLPRAGDAQRPLSDAWRSQHWTAAGIEAIRSRTIHGFYSLRALAARQATQAERQLLRELLRQLGRAE